jgi:hypothetical protein
LFQLLENSRTITAGREFHPALKIGRICARPVGISSEIGEQPAET